MPIASAPHRAAVQAATIAARQRATGVAVAVALTYLALASTASAHLRSGTIAVDYRASILHPVTAAYSAQIYQSDHGLRLTRKPGHVVVMLGYLNEPVFRLNAAGLWVNVASPTAAALRLVPKAQAISTTSPHWQLRRGRSSVTWHDSRTQELPIGIGHGTWAVPLIVDGHRTSLRGELRRFPAPTLWPWLCVLAGMLAVGGQPLLMHRRDLAYSAAIGLAWVAASAAVLVALAFALDAYASPGTWIEGLDATAFIAVGLGVMLRGPRNLHIAGAAWIGLTALAIGLLEGPVFLHPIILSVLPGVSEDLCRHERKRRSCLQLKRRWLLIGVFLTGREPAASPQASRRRPRRGPSHAPGCTTLQSMTPLIARDCAGWPGERMASGFLMR